MRTDASVRITFFSISKKRKRKTKNLIGGFFFSYPTNGVVNNAVLFAGDWWWGAAACFSTFLPLNIVIYACVYHAFKRKKKKSDLEERFLLALASE